MKLFASLNLVNIRDYNGISGTKVYSTNIYSSKGTSNLAYRCYTSWFQLMSRVNFHLIKITKQVN